MRKTTNDELGRLSAEEYAAAPKCPVAVVLDNVRSMNNVGRLCLCGITATPPSRDIHKTALGAELTVPWTYFADTADAVAALRADGYRILCVEQAEGSVSLERWAPESGIRYALVFGNEVDGVQQRVADLCDGAVEIPQGGTKHSLNVSVAAGIVLWEAYRRWLAPGE